VGEGDDVVFGGSGRDAIDVDRETLLPIGTDDGADVIVGDNGEATFDNVAGQSVLWSIASSDAAEGGGDWIFVSNGFDVIIGGTGGDWIDAGTDAARDVVVGDNGEARFDAAGVLIEIRTTDPSIGGDDEIVSGDGPDVVLGGNGADWINVDPGTDANIGSDAGDDVIVGDNGFAIFDNAAGTSLLRQIQTTDPDCGGDDRIFAGEGFDVVLGGSGGDRIDAGLGDWRDVLVGDKGYAAFDASGVLVEIRTTDPGVGGDDQIVSGDGPDVVLGGSGADCINVHLGTGANIGSDTGGDVIVGDNGFGSFDASGTLQRIESTDPLLGGNDWIFSGGGDDILFGGTGEDQIWGGAGRDVLLGDHGVWRLDRPVNQRFSSIFVDGDDGGGDDVIYGDAGDDVILGQQGSDWIYGGAGKDDLIGGHNVVGGADGDDRIYGGNRPPLPQADLMLETYATVGDGADVILGDNGLITRELLTADPSSWKRHPAPFADVVRDVQLFDNADRVGGGDALYGDAGRDVLYGQRGDDALGGGAGDDDLIGGLGSDRLAGGLGSDILIADVGYIHRTLNADGSPRLNTDGSQHRDVYLEEVASLTGSIDLDTTPLRSADPDLAEKILRADLAVLAGGFAAGGAKHLQPDNGAWNTSLLLLDLAPAADDVLDGGDGADVLFGQRGNDTLRGGRGNDTLFGDGATNVTPASTDLPHVLNGVRLIEATAGGVVLEPFGSALQVPATLYPEQLGLNQPFFLEFTLGHVLPELLPEVSNALLDLAGAGPLPRTDGVNLRPLLALVPDVVQHACAVPQEDALGQILPATHLVDRCVLPGHDALDGGEGDDLLVGDNGLVYTPLVTGLTEIDAAAQQAQDALDNALHSLRVLGIDFDHVEHDVRNVLHEQDLHVGRDRIAGGGGADTIVGDNGLVMNSFQLGLPVPEVSFVAAALTLHGQLRDLQQAATDLDFVVFEAHYQVLGELIGAGPEPLPRVDHAHHRLFVGNDTLDGQAGDDLIIGDYGILASAPVTGWRFDQIELSSPISSAAWTAARTALTAQHSTRQSQLAAHRLDHLRQPRTIASATLAQIVWDYDYVLQVGNDVVHGNEGHDVMWGDFGILAVPTALQVPATPDESRELEDDVKVVLRDLSDYLTRRRHRSSYDELHARYDHPHYGERGGANQEVTIGAGNDRLYGDSGDDMVLGDSASLFVMSLADELGPLPASWSGLAFDLRYLWREDFELAGHYRRDGGDSRISNDQLWGGEGNDFLYGQHRDDTVQGNAGSDLVFGGDTGLDLLAGGPEVNPGDVDDVRARGDDSPKLQQLTVFQTRVAAALSALLAAGSGIPEDTDTDGTVTALDVLLLINYLNAGPLYAGVPVPGVDFPAAYDVNRDGRVTALDVLLVINYLNAATVAGGEGESASYPEVFAATPSASPPAAPSPAAMVPAAAASRASPLWPAFASRDAVRAVRVTTVAHALDADPLAAALADLDDVLDDIAEQISRDRRQVKP
jgi:Ca2+-binding RTX toxin-like protein